MLGILQGNNGAYKMHLYTYFIAYMRNFCTAFPHFHIKSKQIEHSSLMVEYINRFCLNTLYLLKTCLSLSAYLSVNKVEPVCVLHVLH